MTLFHALLSALASLVLGSQAVALPADLIAHWTFDGATPTEDVAGTHDGGSLVGAATTATDVPPIPGNVFALSLPSPGSYMSVPHSTDLNFPSQNGSITLWVKQTTPSTVYHVLGKRTGCAGGVFYQMARDPIQPPFFSTDDGIASSKVTLGSELPLDTWTHVAFTFDGAEMKAYQDGCLKQTVAGVFFGASTADLLVGLSGTCPDSESFLGLIDDLRMYDQALSPAEVINLAESVPPMTPPCSNNPPVAIDDFYAVDQLSALNEPTPGVLVNDSDPDESNPPTAALVTGPSHAVSFQLDADGSFSYVPLASYYGPDTFSYQAYDGAGYSDVATVHITVRQPDSQGVITGGGKFFQDTRKCTFGFVAKVMSDGTQGSLKFQDHDMDLDAKAETMDWIYAPNPIDGYFSGACSVNQVTGYSYFVQVQDAGQPGYNDDFSILIYDPYGAEVYSSGGQLSGGNIVIH